MSALPHVIKQGKPAMVDEACLYLTPEGCSCALGGPLVKRGLYSKSMETGTVYSLLGEDQPYLPLNEHDKALRSALDAWGVDTAQYPLLKDLQQAHDQSACASNFITEFKTVAKYIARDCDLSIAVLED